MNFKDTLKYIRDRVRLEDIVEEYEKPARTDGVRVWFRCPFPDHNDSTPSFAVNIERQQYICYGCGKRGDVYNFIQEIDNVSFMDAVRKLADRIGFELKIDNTKSADEKKELKKFYEMYMEATKFYHSMLKTDKGKQGVEYIKKRNLTNETVLKFAIGYSTGEELALYNHLKKLGYDDKIINDSTLVNFSDKGKSDFYYDERVVFPITDEDNRVIAFSGRTVVNSDKKYSNSRNSPIFVKSEHLFGLQYAKNTKKDFFIMCEGNLDCISLHQAGYDNTIAILGLALSEIQINTIKKYKRKIYLALDNDSSGIEGMMKYATELIKNRISVYVINLSPVKDPDEFINKFGNAEFDKRINNAKEYVVALVDLLKNKYDLNDSNQYEDYLDRIASELALYDSEVVRYKMITNVSQALSNSKEEQNIFISDLSKRIVRILKTNENEYISKKTQEVNEHKKDNDLKVNKKLNIYEFSFIQNMLDGNYKKYIDVIKKNLSEDDFTDESIKYIYKSILDNKNANDILSELDENDNIHIMVKKIINYDNNSYQNTKNTKEDDMKEKEDNVKKNLSQLIKNIKVNKLSEQKKEAGFTELVSLQNKINEVMKQNIDF